jgi:hypothetical protein
MSNDKDLPQTPGSMLDAFRSHPEWTARQKDLHLGRIVERFRPEEVAKVVQERLVDLNGDDAEPMLRLVEMNPSPNLARVLGQALLEQPELSLERAWDALSVLEGTSLLGEFPELVDRWEEMKEEFDVDDEGPLAQLIDQIDGDPEGVWLALQGLGAIEPEVREEIITGLASHSPGTGVVEILRLLAYSHEPLTRAAAVNALLDERTSTPRLREARVDLRDHHPDGSVSSSARRILLVESGDAPAASPSARPEPRLIHSLVTAVDGRGRGSVVLSSAWGHEQATAAFLCLVDEGVTEVIGDLSADSDSAFAEYRRRFDCDVIEDAHPLALSVLAGSVLISGPKTPPVLRYWLEATVGSGFRAEPFQAVLPNFDPATVPFDEMPARAEAVLSSCPDWIDGSPLTYELAEELLLRDQGPVPDLTRNPGVFRYLFERRLKGQLERYRRMLLWMTGFWEAGRDHELARSALALAWQLSDAQHVVPGHPFAVGLTTRSLTTAQSDLRRGLDPRR